MNTKQPSPLPSPPPAASPPLRTKRAGRYQQVSPRSEEWHQQHSAITALRWAGPPRGRALSQHAALHQLCTHRMKARPGTSVSEPLLPAVSLSCPSSSPCPHTCSCPGFTQRGNQSSAFHPPAGANWREKTHLPSPC